MPAVRLVCSSFFFPDAWQSLAFPRIAACLESILRFCELFLANGNSVG